MLHLPQIVLDAVQPVYALFKMVGKAGEQGRDLRVLKAIELRNDVIAFFPGLHPVNKVLKAITPETKVINALREHAGEEERVIPYVFADLAFAVEGWGRPIYRVRFHQHLADVGKCAASGVTDLEQLLYVAELGHQVGDIADDLGIAKTDLFRVVPTHELHEELLQWMRFWNHPGSHLQNPPPRRNPTVA